MVQIPLNWKCSASLGGILFFLLSPSWYILSWPFSLLLVLFFFSPISKIFPDTSSTWPLLVDSSIQTISTVQFLSPPIFL